MIMDNGTPLNPADDFIRFTPASGFTGVADFTYQISDGHGNLASGQVSVTVQQVNSPPVAVDDLVTTTAEVPINILVLANDTDADGDTLSLVGVGAATGGSVSVDDNGTPQNAGDDFIHFIPAAGFTGVALFSYQISDGHGGTATGQVHVSVMPNMNPPGGGGSGASISGRVFLDSDGDGIQDGGEGGMSATVELLDGTGAVVLSVPCDASGNYQFNGLSAGSYSIRVLPGPAYVGSFSPRDQGGDDTLDSDVNSSGQSDLFTLLAGEVVGHLDAGFIPAS